MFAVAAVFFTIVVTVGVVLAGQEYGARVGDTRGIIGWTLGTLVFLGGCCVIGGLATL